jgi:hypothetical protein
MMMICKVTSYDIELNSHHQIAKQDAVSLEKMYNFFTNDAVASSFFTQILAQVS